MFLTASLIISLLSACGSDSQNTSEIVAVSETVEEIAETQPESVETEATAETEQDENAQETEVGDVEITCESRYSFTDNRTAIG